MMSMKTFKTIEEEVQTYTDGELQIWNKGYLAAIEGLLEQIQDDQIRLLNKLMEISDDEIQKRKKPLLQSRLVVLDAYEEHYKKRLTQLMSDAE